MPYEIRKSGDGYKVFKKGSSKSFSKKPLTKSKAEDQLAALHINAKENTMIKLKDILNEDLVEEKAFTEFAEKRYDGAEKIATDAKEKGGVALLTYDHFIVKLPYYEKANAGKFDMEEGIKEFNELIKKLADSAEKVDYGMAEFQKLVGKIEVLGELIIKGK